MPFARVSTPEDQIELFWRSNLPEDDPTVVTANGRPTILLLHPVLLTVEYLETQFSDNGLSDAYNMVAFDVPTAGRTKAPRFPTVGQSAMSDNWTEAATIASFCDALGISAVHVFASMTNSVHAALRFAILFPERCLSLTLCGATPQEEPRWAKDAYLSMVPEWVASKGLEEMEEAIGNFAHLWYTNTLTAEEMDNVAAHWVTHYCPKRATNCLGGAAIMILRTPMSTEEMSRVNVPVQILQGDASVFHPLEDAYELAKNLVNVPGGAIVHVIKGGADVTSVPCKTAPQVNAHLAEFLAAHTHVPVSPPTNDDGLTTSFLPVNTLPVTSPFPTLSMNKAECAARFQRALWLSSELAGRPEMKKRNPLSVFSFSRVTEEIRKIKWEQFALPFLEIEKTGYDPTGPNGLPPRLYSERHDAVVIPRTELPRVEIVYENATVSHDE